MADRKQCVSLITGGPTNGVQDTFYGWYDNSGLTGSNIDGTYTPISPYGLVTFYAK
jgi:hypothetical protein